MLKFEDIIGKFEIEGTPSAVTPLGHGKIHHTWELRCGDSAYVLQEMNHYVYKYPTVVMNNLFLVTEYLRGQIAKEGGDSERETLTFLRTRSGNQLLQTENGSYYRLYRMICSVEEMPKPRTPEEAGEAGRVLGVFARRLADFPVHLLSETVPKMHDMRFTLRQLLEAVRADMCLRTSDCQEQIQFVLDRSKKVHRIREAFEEGKIPLRVTHNDTRYNNILVDQGTGKAICLIDLDTVMPGISILDFGDSVRAADATYDVEETFGDIELDLDLYRAHLSGYAAEMGAVLTAEEKQLCAYAVWFSALEQGTRYLIDYLQGDRWSHDFSNERQNLYRAVNQFFLVLDVEEKMEAMNRIGEEIFAKWRKCS